MNEQQKPNFPKFSKTQQNFRKKQNQDRDNLFKDKATSSRHSAYSTSKKKLSQIHLDLAQLQSKFNNFHNNLNMFMNSDNQSSEFSQKINQFQRSNQYLTIQKDHQNQILFNLMDFNQQVILQKPKPQQQSILPENQPKQFLLSPNIYVKNLQSMNSQNEMKKISLRKKQMKKQLKLKTQDKQTAAKNINKTYAMRNFPIQYFKNIELLFQIKNRKKKRVRYLQSENKNRKSKQSKTFNNEKQDNTGNENIIRLYSEQSQKDKQEIKDQSRSNYTSQRKNHNFLLSDRKLSRETVVRKNENGKIMSMKANAQSSGKRFVPIQKKYFKTNQQLNSKQSKIKIKRDFYSTNQDYSSRSNDILIRPQRNNQSQIKKIVQTTQRLDNGDQNQKDEYNHKIRIPSHKQFQLKNIRKKNHQYVERNQQTKTAIQNSKRRNYLFEPQDQRTFDEITPIITVRNTGQQLQDKGQLQQINIETSELDVTGVFPAHNPKLKIKNPDNLFPRKKSQQRGQQGFFKKINENHSKRYNYCSCCVQGKQEQNVINLSKEKRNLKNVSRSLKKPQNSLSNKKQKAFQIECQCATKNVNVRNVKSVQKIFRNVSADRPKEQGQIKIESQSINTPRSNNVKSHKLQKDKNPSNLLIKPIKQEKSQSQRDQHLQDKNLNKDQPSAQIAQNQSLITGKKSQSQQSKYTNPTNNQPAAKQLQRKNKLNKTASNTNFSKIKPQTANRIRNSSTIFPSCQKKIEDCRGNVDGNSPMNAHEIKVVPSNGDGFVESGQRDQSKQGTCQIIGGYQQGVALEMQQGNNVPSVNQQIQTKQDSNKQKKVKRVARDQQFNKMKQQQQIQKLTNVQPLLHQLMLQQAHQHNIMAFQNTSQYSHPLEQHKKANQLQHQQQLHTFHSRSQIKCSTSNPLAYSQQQMLQDLKIQNQHQKRQQCGLYNQGREMVKNQQLQKIMENQQLQQQQLYQYPERDKQDNSEQGQYEENQNHTEENQSYSQNDQDEVQYHEEKVQQQRQSQDQTYTKDMKQGQQNLPPAEDKQEFLIQEQGLQQFSQEQEKSYIQQFYQYNKDLLHNQPNYNNLVTAGQHQNIKVIEQEAQFHSYQQLRRPSQTELKTSQKINKQKETVFRPLKQPVLKVVNNDTVSKKKIVQAKNIKDKKLQSKQNKYLHLKTQKKKPQVIKAQKLEPSKQSNQINIDKNRNKQNTARIHQILNKDKVSSELNIDKNQQKPTSQINQNINNNSQQISQYQSQSQPQGQLVLQQDLSQSMQDDQNTQNVQMNDEDTVKFDDSHSGEIEEQRRVSSSGNRLSEGQGSLQQLLQMEDLKKTTKWFDAQKNQSLPSKITSNNQNREQDQIYESIKNQQEHKSTIQQQQPQTRPKISEQNKKQKLLNFQIEIKAKKQINRVENDGSFELDGGPGVKHNSVMKKQQTQQEKQMKDDRKVWQNQNVVEKWKDLKSSSFGKGPQINNQIVVSNGKGQSKQQQSDKKVKLKKEQLIDIIKLNRQICPVSEDIKNKKKVQNNLQRLQQNKKAKAIQLDQSNLNKINDKEEYSQADDNNTDEQQQADKLDQEQNNQEQSNQVKYDTGINDTKKGQQRTEQERLSSEKQVKTDQYSKKQVKQQGHNNNTSSSNINAEGNIYQLPQEHSEHNAFQLNQPQVRQAVSKPNYSQMSKQIIQIPIKNQRQQPSICIQQINQNKHFHPSLTCEQQRSSPFFQLQNQPQGSIKSINLTTTDTRNSKHQFQRNKKLKNSQYLDQKQGQNQLYKQKDRKEKETDEILKGQNDIEHVDHKIKVRKDVTKNNHNDISREKQQNNGSNINRIKKQVNGLYQNNSQQDANRLLSQQQINNQQDARHMLTQQQINNQPQITDINQSQLKAQIMQDKRFDQYAHQKEDKIIMRISKNDKNSGNTLNQTQGQQAKDEQKHCQHNPDEPKRQTPNSEQVHSKQLKSGSALRQNEQDQSNNMNIDAGRNENVSGNSAAINSNKDKANVTICYNQKQVKQTEQKRPNSKKQNDLSKTSQEKQCQNENHGKEQQANKVPHQQSQQHQTLKRQHVPHSVPHNIIPESNHPQSIVTINKRITNNNTNSNDNINEKQPLMDVENNQPMTLDVEDSQRKKDGQKYGDSLGIEQNKKVDVNTNRGIKENQHIRNQSNIKSDRTECNKKIDNDQVEITSTQNKTFIYKEKQAITETGKTQTPQAQQIKLKLLNDIPNDQEHQVRYTTPQQQVKNNKHIQLFNKYDQQSLIYISVNLIDQDQRDQSNNYKNQLIQDEQDIQLVNLNKNLNTQLIARQSIILCGQFDDNVEQHLLMALPQHQMHQNKYQQRQVQYEMTQPLLTVNLLTTSSLQLSKSCQLQTGNTNLQIGQYLKKQGTQQQNINNRQLNRVSQGEQNILQKRGGLNRYVEVGYVGKNNKQNGETDEILDSENRIIVQRNTNFQEEKQVNLNLLKHQKQISLNGNKQRMTDYQTDLINQMPNQQNKLVPTPQERQPNDISRQSAFTQIDNQFLRTQVLNQGLNYQTNGSGRQLTGNKNKSYHIQQNQQCSGDIGKQNKTETKTKLNRMSVQVQTTPYIQITEARQTKLVSHTNTLPNTKQTTQQMPMEQANANKMTGQYQNIHKELPSSQIVKQASSIEKQLLYQDIRRDQPLLQSLIKGQEYNQLCNPKQQKHIRNNQKINSHKYNHKHNHNEPNDKYSGKRNDNFQAEQANPNDECLVCARAKRQNFHNHHTLPSDYDSQMNRYANQFMNPFMMNPYLNHIQMMENTNKYYRNKRRHYRNNGYNDDSFSSQSQQNQIQRNQRHNSSSKFKQSGSSKNNGNNRRQSSRTNRQANQDRSRSNIIINNDGNGNDNSNGNIRTRNKRNKGNISKQEHQQLEEQQQDQISQLNSYNEEQKYENLKRPSKSGLKSKRQSGRSANQTSISKIAKNIPSSFQQAICQNSQNDGNDQNQQFVTKQSKFDSYQNYQNQKTLRNAKIINYVKSYELKPILVVKLKSQIDSTFKFQKQFKMAIKLIKFIDPEHHFMKRLFQQNKQLASQRKFKLWLFPNQLQFRQQSTFQPLQLVFPETPTKNNLFPLKTSQMVNYVNIVAHRLEQRFKFQESNIAKEFLQIITGSTLFNIKSSSFSKLKNLHKHENIRGFTFSALKKQLYEIVGSEQIQDQIKKPPQKIVVLRKCICNKKQQSLKDTLNLIQQKPSNKQNTINIKWQDFLTKFSHSLIGVFGLNYQMRALHFINQKQKQKQKQQNQIKKSFVFTMQIKGSKQQGSKDKNHCLVNVNLFGRGKFGDSLSQKLEKQYQQSLSKGRVLVYYEKQANTNKFKYLGSGDLTFISMRIKQGKYLVILQFSKKTLQNMEQGKVIVNYAGKLITLSEQKWTNDYSGMMATQNTYFIKTNKL